MYFLPNAVTTSSTKPDPVGWKAGYNTKGDKHRNKLQLIIHTAREGREQR